MMSSTRRAIDGARGEMCGGRVTATATRGRRVTRPARWTTTRAESEVFRAWDQATKSAMRTDLKKIMILGAGPIVIGQVCVASTNDDSRREKGGGAMGRGRRGRARFKNFNRETIATRDA